MSKVVSKRRRSQPASYCNNAHVYDSHILAEIRPHSLYQPESHNAQALVLLIGNIEFNRLSNCKHGSACMQTVLDCQLTLDPVYECQGHGIATVKTLIHASES